MKSQILWSVVAMLLSTNTMTAFARSITSTEPCEWVVTVSIANINENVVRVKSVSKPGCKTLTELVSERFWAYNVWTPYDDDNVCLYGQYEACLPYAVRPGQLDPDKLKGGLSKWMFDNSLRVVTLSCSWVKDTAVSLSRSGIPGVGNSLDSLTSNNPRCSAIVAGVEVKDGVELKLGELD